MKRKMTLKRYMAFLLSIMLMISNGTLVHAEYINDLDQDEAKVNVCELTEGCTQEAGHEGECILNPDDSDDTLYTVTYQWKDDSIAPFGVDAATENAPKTTRGGVFFSS